MLRNKPLMTWGFVFALCLPVVAQSDALNELYGNGVHAFNGGDYVEAYNQLTRAVQNGSQDPRVHYYRGLSYLKLGRPQEAEADFAEAARLEMSDTDRFYNVSKALERVQGRARMMIEKYRSDARLLAFHERERARFERYERIRRNEPNVLLQPDRGEPAEGKAAPAEKPEADAEMPAEEPPAPEDEKPADDNAKPAEEKDPFAETSEEKPGEEMPAEEGNAKEGDAEADPFGDAKEEKPGEEMPAEEGDGETKAADAADSTDATPPKKVPAGKLFKSLAKSVTRGAMKTAAGSEAQAAPAADNAASPPKAEKPADEDPFAN
jgi:tetratricopeptide (TPR) repeat protein